MRGENAPIGIPMTRRRRRVVVVVRRAGHDERGGDEGLVRGRCKQNTTSS